MRPGPAGRNPKRSRLRRQESRARSAARRFWFSALRTDGLFRAPPGRSKCAACGGGDCRVPPRRWFWICRAAPGGAIAGIAAFQAARMTSAFRRAARVPFRTDEKEPKVRLRGLHRPLRYPLEYLAITRRLPPLPTGTPAEGSIQVAGAPNNAHRMARRGHTAENNARSGRSRALRACAAKPRSFPLPRGRCAPRKSGRAPPEAPRYGSGDSRAEALRPRRGGWRDAVNSFVHP